MSAAEYSQPMSSTWQDIASNCYTDCIEHTVYHHDKCKIKDRTKCLDALEIIPIHWYEMNAVVN